jgi:SAM-dependent methyltransferase
MTDREFWDDAYHSDSTHTIVPDHVIAGEIYGLTPGRALDIGCGSGANALTLARAGWDVTGVDFSDHAVFLAERAAWNEGLSARFLVEDATSWNDGKRYDLVVCTYSLPSDGKAIACLRNAVRSVSDGGTIVIAEWNTSMASVWGFRECELFTPERIASEMNGFDIQVQEVRRIDSFFDADDPRAIHGRWAEIAVVRATRFVGMRSHNSPAL